MFNSTYFDQGFTLMEIMVVLCIMLVLMSTVIPSLNRHIEKAQKIADEASAKNIVLVAQMVSLDENIDLESIKMDDIKDYIQGNLKPQVKGKKAFKINYEKGIGLYVTYDDNSSILYPKQGDSIKVNTMN